MSDAPSVLVITSTGCEPTVVTPVLAALESTGAKLRAFDAGRLGDSSTSAVDRVMRAISGEAIERRLEKEVGESRPDVVVCFDVGTTIAMCDMRKASSRPFPVLAVVAELSPSAAWAQCDADRFFVIDNEAAVSLEDHGATGHAILPVGCIGEYAYAEAGSQERSALKRRFKLSGKVALVDVDGLGHEQSSQLALQLSLVGAELTYLFDAGKDTDAATALRSQVPILGMKAKLFGETEDAPLLWRCADVVISRPRSQAINRSGSVGASMVCYSPRDGAETRRANALEERGCGAVAANALMVGSALERVLAGTGRSLAKAGEDGANTIADATWIIGSQRREVVNERVNAASEGRKSDVADAAEFAKWAARAATPAGALEDLGAGGPAPAPPDAAKLRRLQKEIRERKAQVTRTIGDAQKEASRWDAKRARADKLGNADMAKEAERNADLERARMHGALTEMASLEAEERGLERAARAAEKSPPPQRAAEPRGASSKRGSTGGGGTSVHARPSIDEELARMRSEARSSPPPKKSRSSSGKKQTSKSRKSGVDDELAALKRRMARKRKG